MTEHRLSNQLHQSADQDANHFILKSQWPYSRGAYHVDRDLPVDRGVSTGRLRRDIEKYQPMMIQP